MQVIEIKNDLVQVRYNAEEQALSLGDFFVVSDNNADILAQIVHLETDEEMALCLAKFILNINNDNSTSLYNGYMPSLDSVVSPVSKQEIIDFISPVSKGVNMGTLINSDLAVSLSESILDTPLYVQSDYAPACAKLMNFIFNENYIENNVLFYDIDGTFNDMEYPKFELGKNIKVPLNKTFMDFIYENDLNELNVSEKALVQDILLEIKDYIDTTDKDFIEFSTLLNVANAQYEEQPSDALILFRNKLIEYKQLGFFADSQDDVDSFYNAINNKNAIISAYKLAKNWQFALCKFCAKCISKKTHFVIQTSDTSIDENTINTILTSKNIIPVFISNYSSKYRNILRSKIPNMIFFQSIDELADFPLYSNFLNLLFDNTYIIWGEITSFLSIIASYNEPQKISKKELIQPVIKQEIPSSKEPEEQEVFVQDETPDETPDETEEEIFEEISDDIVEQAVEDSFENITEEEPVQVLPSQEDNDIQENEIFEEQETVEEIPETEEKPEETVSLDDLTETPSTTEEEITEQQEDITENTETVADEPSLEIIEDDIDNTFEQPGEDIADDDLDFLQEEELENSEDAEFEEKIQSPEIDNNSSQDNIDETYTEENLEVSKESEESQTETTQDNDMFYEEEPIEDEPEEVNETQEEEDYFTEEPAEEDIPQEQEETYEEIEEPKFSMPVFEAEPQNTDVDELKPSFVEGNIVYHEKYGRGIIEKVISYGAKTLCSIQFDNIGRRLLDPNLADLKQI